MIRRAVTISSVLMVVALAGGAAMAEEDIGNTIVISDGWCSPNYGSGGCNQCNMYHVVRAAKCTGYYCDNMTYWCGDPPNYEGLTWTKQPTVATGWTSDEQGSWSTQAVCPLGYAMVGMNTTGYYSDNLQSLCQYVEHEAGWDLVTMYLYRANSISDETQGLFLWSNTWISGASCTGYYCDNMYYWYTDLY
jgi:hypothetical protein